MCLHCIDKTSTERSLRHFRLACRGIHTYNNCPNGKEHKGILLEESLDVLFGDLLHFPLCLHGAYVNAFPDTLHPAVVNQIVSISANRSCADLPDLDVFKFALIRYAYVHMYITIKIVTGCCNYPSCSYWL